MLRRNGWTKKYITERYVTLNTKNFNAYLQKLITFLII